jgi:hypothetical protein
MSGDYRSVDAGAGDVFAYLRSQGATRFLVVLNFGSSARRLDLSAVGAEAHVAISTEMTGPRCVTLSALDLGPNEGVILRL